jgi:polyhydroxyalkanoate synthesis regulator phasin
MPKKKNQESQKEQSERFKKTVADLVAAGELSPTDADKALESLMTKVKIPVEKH